MAIQTLAFTAPIPNEAWEDKHPLVQFYAAYIDDFRHRYHSTPFDRYYAADCKTYQVDNTILEGGKALWDSTHTDLYGMFPQVERELQSLIYCFDVEPGRHEIHIKSITGLHTKSKRFDVPQAFTYGVGEADDGKGTHGLQFRSLRCYYDRSLIEKAKRAL